MEKYKAILYDLDGTVLNTLDMNMYPLLRIIKEELKEDWTFEEVLRFAPYPGMKVMEELKIKNPEKTYARWVSYVNSYEDGASLYPGFEEVFKRIKKKNIAQAVVSAKKKDQYKIDFVAKGLDVYMRTAVLEEDTKRHKPYPDPLLEALRRLNLEADEVIYIGDSYSDYQAARAAKMDFAHARWGSLCEKPMEGADYSLEKPEDILSLIEDI